MTRKSFFVWGAIAGFLTLVTSPQNGSAAGNIYQLHVIDATGSMTESHGPDPDNLDDPKIERSRFYFAKKEAKIIIGERDDTFADNIYNGFFRLAGRSSGPVTDEGGEIFKDLNTDAYALFDQITQTSWATPLADVICDAMLVLEEIGDADDLKFLYVYTDGEENVSLEANCGPIGGKDALFPYAFDAKKEYEIQGENCVEGKACKVTNNDRADWDIVNGASIIMTSHSVFARRIGRAYTDSSEIQRDWAGGVQPGSWLSRVHYRITWGADYVPANADPINLNWEEYQSNPQLYQTRINIRSYYHWVGGQPVTNTSSQSTPPPSQSPAPLNALVTPMTLSSKLLSARLPVATIVATIKSQTKESDEEIFTRNTANNAMLSPVPLSSNMTSTPSNPYPSLNPIEDSFFAGMAEMTSGLYIAQEKGSPMIYPGDVNMDGVVDADDYNSVVSLLGQTVDPYDPTAVAADIVNDGVITHADMKVIRSAWNDDSNPSPQKGDVNSNGCVNTEDLEFIMQWHGQQVDPNNPLTYEADITGDGFINDDDLDYMDAQVILFVADENYEQETAMYNHLYPMCGKAVRVIKDHELTGSTDLSSYDLIMLTGFSSSMYSSALDNVLNSGKPIFAVEYWDYKYSYEFGLVDDEWCGTTNGTDVELTGYPHEIIEGLNTIETVYDPNAAAIGILENSIQPGVTPLVYSNSSYGRVTLLVDESRKIVTSGIHDARRYTDAGWQIFDNILNYLAQ